MNRTFTTHTYFNQQNATISARTFDFKSKVDKSIIVHKSNFLRVKWTKLFVLGNFFKLRYKKKKALTRFQLCLAHRVYIFVNLLKSTIFRRKLKKNKMLFIKNDTFDFSAFYPLFKLFQKRSLNAYTKKGIKLSSQYYKQKVGKKATY